MPTCDPPITSSPPPVARECLLRAAAACSGTCSCVLPMSDQDVCGCADSLKNFREPLGCGWESVLWLIFQHATAGRGMEVASEEVRTPITFTVLFRIKQSFPFHVSPSDTSLISFWMGQNFRNIDRRMAVFAELLSNGRGVFLNVVHELFAPLSLSEASVDIY